MSIRDLINGALGERLFHLKPLLSSDPVNRTMFMSEEVRSLVEGPWSSPIAERRCMQLRADLEAFVIGDAVSVCLEPFKAKDALFGRLYPPGDEVWDFRSRNPKPGLRLLGRFVECDTFVAFTCWPRSRPVDFLERPPLLEGTSREWDFAINEAKAEWRKLFLAFQPHGSGGDDVRDYISENVVSV